MSAGDDATPEQLDETMRAEAEGPWPHFTEQQHQENLQELADMQAARADELPAAWLNLQAVSDAIEGAIAAPGAGPAMTAREQATYELLLVEAFDRLLAKVRPVKRAAAEAAFTKAKQREVSELNGIDLGNVRLDPKPGGWKITNRAAFEAWVEEHHPTEMVEVTTTSVAKSFETYVLATLKRGEPIEQDETNPITGEVFTRKLTRVPGVTDEPNGTKLVATPSKQAPGAILDVLGDLAATLAIQVPDRKALEA